MKIAILYGSTMGNTESAAKKIKEQIEDAALFNAGKSSLDKMVDYDVILLGSSTWGMGDLQDDWEEVIDYLSELELEGKKIALFGTGDQVSYPDTFVDALGILYEALRDSKVDFIGRWPLEGYEYSASKAEQKGMFLGLVLDEDNQPEMTGERIIQWVEKLKTEI